MSARTGGAPLRTYGKRGSASAGGSPARPAACGGSAAASAGGVALDVKQAAVVEAFGRYAESDEGAHVADIERAVAPKGISREEVAAIVEALQTEGVIYSTTDEYHYKLTG